MTSAKNPRPVTDKLNDYIEWVRQCYSNHKIAKIECPEWMADAIVSENPYYNRQYFVSGPTVLTFKGIQVYPTKGDTLHFEVHEKADLNEIRIFVDVGKVFKDA